MLQWFIIQLLIMPELSASLIAKCLFGYFEKYEVHLDDAFPNTGARLMRFEALGIGVIIGLLVENNRQP